MAIFVFDLNEPREDLRVAAEIPACLEVSSFRCCRRRANACRVGDLTGYLPDEAGDTPVSFFEREVQLAWRLYHRPMI